MLYRLTRKETCLLFVLVKDYNVSEKNGKSFCWEKIMKQFVDLNIEIVVGVVISVLERGISEH